MKRLMPSAIEGEESTSKEMEEVLESLEMELKPIIRVIWRFP